MAYAGSAFQNAGGGFPLIPYGRQTIEEDDLQAVLSALRSDWLTQGPKVQELEEALARYCGARYAVVFSSGTAALQAACFAAGLGSGDEVITSPITFVATTNAVLWFGARPIFADIQPETGNIDPEQIESRISPKTKAILPVDYAGHPADLQVIREIARKRNLLVIEDACHALGATYQNHKIGSLSDVTVFSFHPVKSITTGEGGAVLTQNKSFYERLTRFRHHGIQKGNDWEYDVLDLGLNYRLTDIQCALGLSQLRKLDRFIATRQRIAERYTQAFQEWGEIAPVLPSPDSRSAWHLYVIRLQGGLAQKRREVFRSLRQRKIGVQVHYIPVYQHPYYQAQGYSPELCPQAEDFYSRIISLPIYPTLTASQQDEVIQALGATLDSIYESSPAR